MLQGFYLKSIIQWCVPIFVSALAYAWYYTPDWDILHDENVFVIPYNDRISGGNSSNSFHFDESGHLSYTYILRDSIRFPYAGIMILNKDSSFFDLSSFDRLLVRVRDNARKGVVPVYLFTNIEGYSTWESVVTFVNAQSIIAVEDFGKTAEVTFESFVTPKWWYDQLKQGVQSNVLPDFGQVALFNFAAQGSSQMHEEYTVCLEEVVVSRDMTVFYMVTALFLVLYYAALIILKYNGHRQDSPQPDAENKRVTFSYERVAVVRDKDYSDSVFEYINNHYYLPEFSIADVQNATGLPERKLSQIIKEKTDLTFKQYLNNIRLSEAKRMLKDTDLHVSEIAYKIGYNNVTHFNRVFKLSENISPSNFRSQAETKL